MSTKRENYTLKFNTSYREFYRNLSYSISSQLKNPQVHVYLHSLVMDEGALSVIRVQPVGSTFNISCIDGVMDDLEAVFSKQFDAAIIFDRSATQLVTEQYDEYAAAYLHLHFLVKKWKDFEKLQKLHELMQKEEAEKQAIKREAQRVRDEARRKKLADSQEKQERKLYEKLKKKFGETP